MAFHQRLFFLLIVFLPTQLGLHFWPDWAHLLGRRVDYLSPTLYLTDIIIFVLIGAWLMSGKLGKLGNYGRLGFFVVLFAAFNIYGAVSPWVALYKWVKVMEFAGLGWYIISTKPKLADVSFPLSIGVLYSSLIAIAQFILQRSAGGPLWILGERMFTIDTPGIARIDDFRLLLRPYATFPHPNVLGGFLAITVPILLTHKRHIRRIGQTSVFLGLIALALTWSRSAWFVAGIAITLLFARSKKRAFRSILVVFIILYSLFMMHVIRTIQSADESVARRIELNVAAISMWRQAPLLGIGLGNFLVQLPNSDVSRQINFLQPTHNIYLLILVETGIVGLMLFLWGIMKTTWTTSLVCLLFLGLVDHYPITLQQGQLLFTVVFALAVSRR